MAQEALQDKGLEVGKHYPNLRELLGAQTERTGRLDVQDKEFMDSSYRISQDGKGARAVITVRQGNDTHTYTVIVEENGTPKAGSIDSMFRDSKTDKYSTGDRISLNHDRCVAILKYFQPLAEASKKDRVVQEERERLKKLPQLPGSIFLPLFGLPTRNLDESEMKRNPYILFGDKEKVLPVDPPSVPFSDYSSAYVHTDTCSVVGQFGKSYFHHNPGVTVFYFPRLFQEGRRSSRDGDYPMNTYWNAVVFPKTLHNSGDIVDVWYTAYSMIKKGADDKKVYDFMFEQAKRIESDAKRR